MVARSILGGTFASGDIARSSLVLVRNLMLANLAFNVLAVVLGFPYPLTSFLFEPADVFGDFFKFALSFPGGATVAPGRLLPGTVAAALAAHDYAGIAGFKSTALTHFHTPPLTVLICFASIATMRAIDPALVFGLILLGLLGYWCRISALAGRDRRETSDWVLLGLLSYPMLLMVDRGNVYAGLTALLVVHTMLLAGQNRAPVLAGVLLAIAVNIRPNAIVFAVPLLLLMRSGRVPALIALAISGAVIGVASLLIAHGLYPDYTLMTFRAGLARYYQVYVMGDLGLQFGSSLFGAVKFLVGYRPGVDLALTAIALAILLGGVVQYWRGRLSAGCLLFLVAAAYALGSTIICDYHLLVFIAVPMLAAAGEQIGAAEAIACAASCLLLAPKNYVFTGGVSWQIVINPLILLIAAVAVLVLHARRITAACPDGGCSPAVRAA